MAVSRKRASTEVPAFLSISYLIGSPPTGTSMMTLTSRGGSIPIEMASMRMAGSAWLLRPAHGERRQAQGQGGRDATQSPTNSKARDLKGLQVVQAKATLSSDFGPNFSELRATMRPPSAR